MSDDQQAATIQPTPSQPALADALAEINPGSADPDRALTAFVEWAESTGLSLYPAQEEALLEIAAGANVILATPTGSGKSLVASGAHFFALAEGNAAGKRTYYTAPIKALVSEKFFALIDLFGAENVGMITGDSSVNPEATIICCTAEILANLALREGDQARVGQVVMDEFHFYADPERGWAWQVPLLTLPQAQFVLMSATLGDVTELSEDLTRRTGRPTAEVTGTERPVPLSYTYATTPVHETVEELLHAGRSPIYIVHFGQAAAVERAQSLTSLKILSRDKRDALAEEIGDFRFTTGFGKTLSRLVRSGIGVHHAGMLPRYRRLVEHLAGRGLLPVICGTDTLGVGINVPIRTVLLTALTKYDGEKMRHLSAREFHQIAGRAGRAGFDTSGDVVVQAPDHEIENLKAVQKAGDDPKKKRKIIRKKTPPGFVSWGEPSFTRLIAAPPEPLTSSMQITHSMILNLVARGGDVLGNARALIFDSHEPRKRQFTHARRALDIFRTLRQAGIIEVNDGAITLTVDLQPGFALNQPLSPFAIAAIELHDPDSPSFALDVISTIEATLENPRPILYAQENIARSEAVRAMKAEGIEYDQRMELLEEITSPKPLAELLEAAYAEYTKELPWALDFELRPKSVVRDMYERAFGFRDLVSFYQLARSEGVVLRYLSDAYRAIRQTVPQEAKTEELTDIIEWLGELVQQVDSSLLEEWAQLSSGDTGETGTQPGDVLPPAPHSILTNRRAFTVLVRNQLFRRVQLAALERWGDLGELDATAGFTADRWAEAMDDYFDEYDDLGVGSEARSGELFMVDDSPETEQGLWLVRQVFDDPNGDHDWAITAKVDLAASVAAGEPVITLTGVQSW